MPLYFVHFLLPISTLFTYLVYNSASLLTAVNVLSLNINKSQNQTVFSTFWRSWNASVTHFEPFYPPKWQIPLLFHTPEAWKRCSFHAEPPRTGHPHPPGYDLTLAFITRGLKAMFILKALVPNKEVINNGSRSTRMWIVFFFLDV